MKRDERKNREVIGITNTGPGGRSNLGDKTDAKRAAWQIYTNINNYLILVLFAQIKALPALLEVL